MTFEFVPLTRDDLPQILDWLERDHVKRWWDESRTREETEKEYGDAIDGRDPSDHYVIVADGRAIGMIETYLVADHPEWEALVRVGPEVAGVDLFIGEEELLGRGLGAEILRTFARDVVFARSHTHAVVAGVDVRNRRSLRAFEKAGFTADREFLENGKTMRLFRLARPE